MIKGSKEDELEIFSMARNALIIPMALISLVAMYHVVEMCSAKPRHRALIISRVSMFIFMVKMTYYTLLSRGYGLAFQNQRCYDLRPIYGTRYAGWTFAVPTIVFMNLYPLMDEHRLIDVLIRLSHSWLLASHTAGQLAWDASSMIHGWGGFSAFWPAWRILQSLWMRLPLWGNTSPQPHSQY